MCDPGPPLEMVKECLADSVPSVRLPTLSPTQVLLALVVASAIKTNLGHDSDYQPHLEMTLAIDGLWVSLEAGLRGTGSIP